MVRRKKLLLTSILFVVLLCVTVIGFLDSVFHVDVLKLEQRITQRNSQAGLTAKPTPAAEAASEEKWVIQGNDTGTDNLKGVVKRTNTLPESEKQKILPQPITIDGIRYVRELGKILSVKTQGELYQVKLDSGKEITVELNPKTLRAKAWYGYDSDGNLTNIQYQSITLDKLAQLKPGDSVRLAYQESDLQKSEQVPVAEFVILP